MCSQVSSGTAGGHHPPPIFARVARLALVVVFVTHLKELLIRDAALPYSFDITDIHEQFNRTLKPVTRCVPQTHRLHQPERDLY